MKTSLLTIFMIVLIVGLVGFLQNEPTGASLADLSVAGGYGGMGVILEVYHGMREYEIDRDLQKLVKERHRGSVHLSRIELANWGITVRKGEVRTPGGVTMNLIIHVPSRGTARIYDSVKTSEGFTRLYGFQYGSDVY